MRFILLALALIGVAFYISNPQAFGVKQKFEMSGGGRVVRNDTGGAKFDFSKIGEFGAELYDRFTSSPDDSASSNATDVASAELGVAAEATDSRVLSAIEAPALSTYEGRLAAISAALHEQPEETAAYMQAATQACLAGQAPDQMVNYFSGLVQVVALTSQLPQAQQVESFKAQSAPLTEALKAWLKFMPEEQRIANTQILQAWAAQPKALVACHQAWLSAN